MSSVLKVGTVLLVISVVLLVSGESTGSHDKKGLQFTDHDIESMNWIYQTYVNETAYCGVIDAERVVDVELASIESSEFKAVTSNRDECSFPFGYDAGFDRKVALHTHPLGHDSFSEQDLENLVSSHYMFSCIQYSEITVNEDYSLDGLKCVSQDGVDSVDEEFPEVETFLKPKGGVF